MRVILLFLLAFVLTSCSSAAYQRGYVISHDEQLSNEELR